MAQIIMIPKPNKDSINVRSYRPISLLPVIVEERLIPIISLAFAANMQQLNKSTELLTKLV